MKITHKLRREDGAAAVEFALIVGVLAMLIFGMLQYGLAFFQLQNLRAATREGARAGAVGAPPIEVKRATSAASLGALTLTDPAIHVDYWENNALKTPNASCPPKDQQGTSSQVRVSVNISQASQQFLKDIFIVDIPMLPPIPLTPTIIGVFRCEGN